MSTKLRVRLDAVPPFSWAVSIVRAIASATWNSRLRLSRYLHRKILGFLVHSRVGTIDVYAWAGDAERIERAIAFLERLDERRSRRVRKYVTTIVLSEHSTHFDDANDACYFDFHATPSELNEAVALVHEATHAYLLRARHLRYAGELRETHERVCLREEAALIRSYSRRLEPEKGAQLVTQWKEHHERGLASRWWERGRWEHFRGTFAVMLEERHKNRFGPPSG